MLSSFLYVPANVIVQTPEWKIELWGFLFTLRDMLLDSNRAKKRSMRYAIAKFPGKLNLFEFHRQSFNFPSTATSVATQFRQILCINGYERTRREVFGCESFICTLILLTVLSSGTTPVIQDSNPEKQIKTTIVRLLFLLALWLQFHFCFFAFFW